MKLCSPFSPHGESESKAGLPDGIISNQKSRFG
jgi:hypothetical protein